MLVMILRGLFLSIGLRLMAIPNLTALVLLSPVVFGLTREYFIKQRQLAANKVN
jgi:Na+/alanine symporter